MTQLDSFDRHHLNNIVLAFLNALHCCCWWDAWACCLQVLKEQLAQAAAAKERSGSAEQAEYAKNVVVNYLETRDPSLLPALRQVMDPNSNVQLTKCCIHYYAHTIAFMNKSTDWRLDQTTL